MPRQKYQNRRSHYLIKQLGWLEDEAIAFLRDVWECLITEKVLLRTGRAGFGLDAQLLWLNAEGVETVGECNRCSLKQRHYVNHKCSAFRCDGEVLPLGDDAALRFYDNNHYYRMYTDSTDLGAVAREHTASAPQGHR